MPVTADGVASAATSTFQAVASAATPSSMTTMSWAASWAEFCGFYAKTLCLVSRTDTRSDQVDRDLIRFGDQGAAERFQRWVGLKLVLWTVIEVLGLATWIINPLNLMVLPLKFVAVLVALVGIHLIWFTVVKRKGESCGLDLKKVFVMVSLWLLIEPVVYGFVGATFLRPRLHFCLYVLYLPNFFLIMAGYRLATAPPPEPVAPQNVVVSSFQNARTAVNLAVSSAQMAAMVNGTGQARDVKV